MWHCWRWQRPCGCRDRPSAPAPWPTPGWCTPETEEGWGASRLVQLGESQEGCPARSRWCAGSSRGPRACEQTKTSWGPSPLSSRGTRRKKMRRRRKRSVSHPHKTATCRMCGITRPPGPAPAPPVALPPPRSSGSSGRSTVAFLPGGSAQALARSRVAASRPGKPAHCGTALPSPCAPGDRAGSRSARTGWRWAAPEEGHTDCESLRCDLAQMWGR